MKIIWKLTGVVVLTTVMAGSVFAQGRGPQSGPPKAGAMGGPGGPGGRMRGPGHPMDAKQMNERTKKMVHERLKPALKLTDAQEKKVLAIYLKSNKDMAAIFKGKKDIGSDEMKKMRAVRDKREKAVNAVLTPAQKKLYKTFLEKQHRGMGGPGGPGGMGGPGGPGRRPTTGNGKRPK
jgi:hypothetical protein